MTEHDKEAYGRAVVEVIANPALLQELKRGALASAERYSIEDMVDNFRTGIRTCLQNSRS